MENSIKSCVKEKYHFYIEIIYKNLKYVFIKYFMYFCYIL